MKYLLIISLAALFCCKAYPQGYANTWVFGDSVGLNFNDSNLINFKTSMLSREPQASISDSLGNLLFYSNGRKVWNNNHEIMVNGDSLSIGGGNAYDGSSTTQGVVIVPKPNSNHLYYIFQLQGNVFPVENYGLEYTLIDMTIDSGLGGVVEKNINLYDIPLTEKMQAIKHGNGRDWWLLVRQSPAFELQAEDISFVRFLITQDGVEGPFLQFYGADYLWTNSNIGEVGEMIFSNNGNKLAFISGENLDIYDFDRCTGELSNIKSVIDVQNGVCLYGCSFSQDGTKLYVSTECDGGKNLFQYCLDCDIPIDSTKTLIFKTTSSSFWLSQHELGPDEKIYIAMSYAIMGSNVYDTKNQNLCVINSPNELGLTCDFDTNTISLGDRRVIYGLPNMPNYNLGALRLSPCDTLNVALTNFPNQGAFTIYPNPASTIVTVKGNITMQDVVIIQSLDGQLLHTYTNSAATKQIPVTALANGVYVLQIVRNNEVYFSEQLVILR